MSTNNFSYVIPLYIGAEYIKLLKEIISKNKVLQKVNFILVDDSDITFNFENHCSPQTIGDNIFLIKTGGNVGQHAATAIGFNYAEEVVVTIDQDAIPFLLEIHSICQKLNPKEKELIYICPKTRQRHWFRNLGSFLTLQIINSFSRFKLRGIFSIRVIGKSSDTFVKIRPHFVFDLFLLSKGYKARYIETDFKISDKKGSYTFLKLSKVFLNITLFYTFLFESLAIVILCLYLLIKSFIIIVLFCFITLLLVFKYYNFNNANRKKP